MCQNMENETLGQELVKCVLVGDTATGKTRLVCARALNARVSLRQLLRQHVPTVWAIDQYRMYKEVLERSMTIVDGVQVSLRLWDTFGDPEKDRRFAYGRSDVILLCFSIGNKNSLMHCKTVWFPEIRRFCGPDTPIVLVGCKNDLRFLCKDSTFLSVCKDKSPHYRPTRECDVVMPEQARAIAKEFNVPYYETSVFTYFGVTQVFENAIRCALLARRNQRFWMTHLKHVQQPLLQAPYCPPKKEFGEIEIFPGTFGSDMKDMATCKRYPDLVFATGNTEITAHRFIVAAASPSLEKLMEPEKPLLGRRNSETSATSESTVDETECLLKSPQPSTSAEGYINSIFSDSSSEFDLKLNESPCNLIKNIWIRTAFDDVKISQLVLKLSDTVSPDALKVLIHFIYTGELSVHVSCSFESMKNAAQIFENTVMTQYLDAWSQRDIRLMADLRQVYKYSIKSKMWEKCLTGYFCDVDFQLEDGKVPAHRAFLMSRSDVMKAMFSRDFRERRSLVVTIRDVHQEAFLLVLEYLYTDSIASPVTCDVGMEVLELGNRFCMTRLVNFMESTMIRDFTLKQNQGIDIMECCLKVLELAQLHNVDQLGQWCLMQLATNYDLVCRKHNKLFKELSKDNCQIISQSRWPPVWYVKDFDYYQKAVITRYKLEHSENKSRKRNNSGCLCFSGKSRKNVPISEHALEDPKGFAYTLCI